MDKKVLGIWGAGGLGREVLELARTINSIGNRWERIVFIDDEPTKTEVNGSAVVTYKEFKEMREEAEAVIGIGEPAIREVKFNVLKNDGIKTPSLIHPEINIPETTTIGDGTIIQYRCFISCNVTIGENVYIQPHCNISHDDRLADGCMVSGFSNIAGNVKIGKYAYLGLSAIIKENITIGDNAIVGMGSAVFKDVPDEIIVLGNPAKPIWKNEDRLVFRH